MAPRHCLCVLWCSLCPTNRASVFFSHSPQMLIHHFCFYGAPPSLVSLPWSGCHVTCWHFVRVVFRTNTCAERNHHLWARQRMHTSCLVLLLLQPLMPSRLSIAASLVPIFIAFKTSCLLSSVLTPLNSWYCMKSIVDNPFEDSFHWRFFDLTLACLLMSFNKCLLVCFLLLGRHFQVCLSRR